MARLVLLPDPAAVSLKGAFRVGRRVAQLARSGQPVRLLVAGGPALGPLLDLLAAEGQGFRDELPWGLLEVVCEGAAALRQVEKRLLATGVRPGLGVTTPTAGDETFQLALLALDPTGRAPASLDLVARADEVWVLASGEAESVATARLFAEMESWECGSEPTLLADAAAASRIDPASISRESCRSDACLRVVA
jgi:hypothetical protein